MKRALFFLLLGTVCLCGTAERLWAETPSPEIINIHSMFGSEASSQITVSWRSPFVADEELQRVEYGTSPEYGTTATAKPLESGGGLQHHAELKGLQPGTTYHYRVCSGEAFGPDCTFRTALPVDSKETFTFAVIGDVEGGANGNPAFPELTQWLVKKNPAFFMVLGDLVYYGQQQSGWDGFFRSGSNLFNSCVFAPVLGDHGMERLIAGEGGETVIGREAPWLYLDQFLLPDNGTKASYTFGRHSLRGLWYAFDYGPAHILSLENTDELTAPFREATEKQQPSWVVNDLAQTKAAWRFILSHRVFYPYESETTQWDHINKRRLEHRTQWDEILANGHVDLAMGAHIGGWTLSHPILNGEIAEDESDGTIHIKLPKVGNYSKKPAKEDLEHWATAVPKDADQSIPGLILLITVSPEGTDVVAWDWAHDREYHRTSLKPKMF